VLAQSKPLTREPSLKPMIIKKAQLLFLLVVLLQSVHAQVTKVQNGILVKAGNQPIGLYAVDGAAFCLSLNDSTAPSKINSVFIDLKQSVNTPYTLIAEAPAYGIKTAYGKLMINTQTKVWSLYDASGRLLIHHGTYASTDSTILITQDAQGLFYGSGNKATKALEKDRSSSSVSNGVADIPYFWNNGGYSAFGVSGNDNIPPTWNRNKDPIINKDPITNKDQTTLTWTYTGKAANF
jgi:alpha-glucosidase